MIQHLPILIVTFPLLASPLCILLGDTKRAWVVCMLVSIFNLVASIILLLYAKTGQEIVYHLGGWEPPYGIAYRLDALSALMAVLLCTVFCTVNAFSIRTFAVEFRSMKIYVIYAVLLMMQTGFLGIVMADDIFNIFVFLEIASIASYGLLAANAKPSALTATFRYLLLGSVGSGFFLLGIGCLYILTGTLNLQDLGDKLPQHLGQPTALAAIAFICAGLCVKCGLFPLHSWLVDIYQNASTTFVAIVAAVGSKTAIYILMRLFGDIFSMQTHTELISQVLFIFAILAIGWGSLLGVRQTCVLRLTAYSSVAQIGFIFLGISLFTQSGFEAAIIYLIIHSLVKSALFITLGFLVLRLGSSQLSMFAGLHKNFPLSAALLVFGGLALIGIPLTPGFVGKWFLVVAAIEKEAWGTLVASLVGSLLTALYVWKLLEHIYFRPRIDTITPKLPDNTTLKPVLYAAIFMTSLAATLGFWPVWLWETAGTASLIWSF